MTVAAGPADFHMKTWTWGGEDSSEGEAAIDDFDFPFSQEKAGSGEIKLVYQRIPDEQSATISVHSVKRPSGVKGLFCTLALPAAMNEFTMHPIPFSIRSVQSMTVAI